MKFIFLYEEVIFRVWVCVCVFVGLTFFSKSDIIFLYCFRTFFVACKKKSIKERGWFALFGYEWNETNLELPVHSESGLNACYFLGKFFVTGESKKRDSFTSFNIVNELSGFQKNMSFFSNTSYSWTWLTNELLLNIHISFSKSSKKRRAVNENGNFVLHASTPNFAKVEKARVSDNK